MKKSFKHLTVGDLRNSIKDLPEDMLIGRCGHFGEFVGVNDIQVTNAYITPDGNWRNKNREFIQILEIETPDLGPDPD